MRRDEEQGSSEVSNLVIPDPRKTPLAFGWAEVNALAVLEQVQDWDELEEYEAVAAAYESYCKAHGIDATELLKIQRIIDKRKYQIHDGQTLEQISSALEVSLALAGQWKQLADNWAWLWPERIAPAENPARVTRAACLRYVAERTAPTDVDLPADWQSGDGHIRLLAGDFRERLGELPDDSVSLILTDPPYPNEALPLWSDLAKHAERILSPQGYMLSMSGKIHLDEVMGRLSEHLKYRWIFNWPLPGSNSRIMAYNIRQTWKPVLCYTTGSFYRRDPLPDTIPTSSPEKGLDDWQQQAHPARWLIERLSPPDGLVVDPFLGTGSFGVAALLAGRRFIGVELRPDRFQAATERLANV